jgi:enoyl-CoA hydratase
MRIVLDRPNQANAQDPALLYQLNDAFDRAAQDDDVRVVILSAEGRHFSSGHDLAADWTLHGQTPVGCWAGFDQPGAEGYFAAEEEIFLGLCWRWRNFPKPTIAQVHGKVIGGGLMLIWPCDLIIASSDASFSDPVAAFGVNGIEYFAHAWEFGARKAKELLFTGHPIGAEEAHRLGMVNHVVDRADLESFTLEMATTIAARPTIGMKLAKQAVNQSIDAQGLWTALQAAFSLHHLGHSHNQQLYGLPGDPSAAEVIRELARMMPRDLPRRE